jgi:hyaluronoglucosaminidase
VNRAAALAVVEGFYGAPWSHEARRRVLRFAARCGFAAYIWAPKSHPGHRSRWHEPPAADHVARTAQLAEEARALGMR